MKTTLAALTLLATAALTRTAEAEPNESCLAEVERTSTRLLMDIAIELDRRTASRVDHFAQVHAALEAYWRYAGGEEVDTCAVSDLDARSRYATWRRRHASGIVRRAQKRLTEVCTRYTRNTIERAKRRIDDALDDNRMARAAAGADELEQILDSDPTIVECNAMIDEVFETRTGYLAGVRAQVALPRVKADAEASYARITATIRDITDALRTSGESIRPVPGALDEPGGQRALLEQIGQCSRFASALRALGAGDDLSLSVGGEIVSLADASARCRDLARSSRALFDEVEAHNAAYEQAMLERWKYFNIKGWDMQSAFDERGKPVQVDTKASGRIHWTYRDEGGCVELRFTPRGRAVGRAKCR